MTSKNKQIKLPASYKPYCYPEPESIKNFGLWFEVESFKRAYKKARAKSKVNKALKLAKLHPWAFYYVLNRVQSNKAVSFANRKIMEKFIIAAGGLI